MKRSRPALALFLCTFAASLLAVGFADGESHPLGRSNGLQPGDLDQLYAGFSPSCSLGFPHGVAACESSINVDCSNACPATTEICGATDWIASLWIDLWASSVIESVAREINDLATLVAAHASDAGAESCDADDSQYETMCGDWMADECAAAAQAASDTHFLYALSGKWRTSRQESADCIDGCLAIERYLQDDQYRLAELVADPRHSRGCDEAVLLNRLSEGLISSPAADEEALLRFVAQNFGPAYALAISRHAPVHVRRYESLWNGCDGLPDASIEGWQNNASRAATLQTWRAIISPLADIAGQAAQQSQGLVTIVSQQIAGWLIERGESVASELPPAGPSKNGAPRNATRSNEAFIVL